MVALEEARIIFMGSSRFAVPSLEALVRGEYRVVAVVTQPPRPAGRGRKLTAPPTMEAAERLRLPVIHPEKIRTPEALGELAQLEPHLIVVAAYAQILPRALLELPLRGCINVHASLLPRWRGASPIHASILAGDEFTGVSIMVMEPSMDTGPVLGQIITRIEDSDTTPGLEARLAGAGAALLMSVLPHHIAGEIKAVPQDEGRVTYAPILKKEDGLIDWTMPAERIWRMCRAFQPWPGSYSYWKGQRLRVISCRLGRLVPHETAPGTVVSLAEGREVGVVAGGGVLVLDQVAPEGGRVMSGEEFSRGHRDFIGSRLG